jgi:hypothetical protein
MVSHFQWERKKLAGYHKQHVICATGFFQFRVYSLDAVLSGAPLACISVCGLLSRSRDFFHVGIHIISTVVRGMSWYTSRALTWDELAPGAGRVPAQYSQRVALKTT